MGVVYTICNRKTNGRFLTYDMTIVNWKFKHICSKITLIYFSYRMYDMQGFFFAKLQWHYYLWRFGKDMRKSDWVMYRILLYNACIWIYLSPSCCNSNSYTNLLSITSCSYMLFRINVCSVACSVSWIFIVYRNRNIKKWDRPSRPRCKRLFSKITLGTKLCFKNDICTVYLSNLSMFCLLDYSTNAWKGMDQITSLNLK